MKTKKHYITLLIFNLGILLFLFGIVQTTYAQTTETFTTSTTWTAPTGVTSVTVECWGAGGGGGSSNSNNIMSGGGGGGAYARSILTVVPGNNYNIIVGSGGGPGIAGGSSSFNTSSVIAVGGAGVSLENTNGGLGGQASACTGTTRYSGGNGGNSTAPNGGGGGGGAGSTGPGGSAGAAPSSGTGTTLNGGNGGLGGNNSAGSPGSNYGGGGGGSGKKNTGGTGANGLVTVTYTAATSNCPASTSVGPTGTQTLCQGDASSQLTANVTTSGSSGTPTIQYQWYYNTSNSNTVSGASLISGATSQTYSPLTTAAQLGTRWYFCVGYATDNNCAQTNATQSLASTNTVQVTVNPPPTTSIAGSPQTICNGSGTTLGANTPTIGTGTWSVVSGPSTSTGQFSSTTNPSATFTPAGGNGNYVLRWTISNDPCTPSSSDVTITVNAQPTISDAGSPQSICTTDSAILAANTPTVGTGLWSIVSGPSTSTTQFISTTNPGTTFTPAGGVGDYVLQWTIFNAPCTPSSSTVTITVIQTPATPGSISGPTTVNPNTSGIIYSISPVTYATFYTWSVPAGWTINSGQNTNSISLTSGASGQNGNISVYAGNTCGNSATTSLAVTSEAVNCPIPTTSVAPNTLQNLCVGDSATTLTATVTTSGGSGTPTIQYQWYYNTSNSNNIGSATLISGATSDTYTPDNSSAAAGNRYYFCVGYASDNGCGQSNATQSQASNQVRVLVTPIPDIPGAISGQPDTTPNTSGYIYSISAVTYAISYTWTVPSGWAINSGQGSTSISVTSGADGQNGTITVTATNVCGTSAASILAVTSTTAASPPTITLGTIAQICKGTTTANLPYTATTDNPDLYSITFNSTALAAGFSNVVDAALPVSPIPITVPAAAPKAKYYGTLKVKNSSTGYSSIGYSIVIDVNEIPPTPIISGNSTVPQNSTGFKYSASASGATSYTWSVPSGFTITAGQGTSQITVSTGSAQAAADITVTSTNTCGTSASGSKTVVISVATNHTYYNCSSCHITHSAPGMNLTNISGNDNLCQSCHTSTGAASSKPFTAADNINTFPSTGDSHAWNVNAVNPSKETNVPSNSQMALRVISGQIICSTCHDQHNTSVASPHLRASNVGDAMCKDCHSQRNKGLYSTDNVNNRGSHPVGVTYNGGDSRFNAAPTNTQLVNSKVECSSCHGVHDVSGSLGLAANGNLLRTTNDASLCTDCHNYGTHNGMTCLDCHEVHNTVDGTIDNNIYMIKRTITTPVSGDKNVIFTARSGNNSFADGLGADNPEKFDGICEVCHDPNYDATPLPHFLNNGSGSDQYHTSQGAGIPGQNCTVCHPHSSNFSPSGGGCTSCHESQAPTFLSAVHVTHKDKYACATCHFGHGSGGTNEGGTHPNGTINIVFDPNGVATRNGQDTNTPTWSGTATKTCSTIYCHSNGGSSFRGSGNDYDTGTTNVSWSSDVSHTMTYINPPAWNSGTNVSCGQTGTPFMCHEGPSPAEAAPANLVNDVDYVNLMMNGTKVDATWIPPFGQHTRGAHIGNDYTPSAYGAVQCFWCHSTDATVSTGSKYEGTYGTSFHVDGQTRFFPELYPLGTMVTDLNPNRTTTGGHCGASQSCW